MSVFHAKIVLLAVAKSLYLLLGCAVAEALPSFPCVGDATMAAATSPPPCVNDSIPLHAVHVGGELHDEDVR